MNPEPLTNTDKVKAGEVYLFLKSGNLVRAIMRDLNSDYGKQHGQNMWYVERVDTKKGMIVSERALVPPETVEV